MIGIIFLVLYLGGIGYLFSAYREQRDLIMQTQEMLRLLRTGVCEQRLSVSEIRSSCICFDVLNKDTVYEYLLNRNELFLLDESTLLEFRLFERESVYGTAEQSSTILCSACDQAQTQLQQSLTALKGRMISILTLVTVFALIIWILMV